MRDASRQRNLNINRDLAIATNWLSKCSVSLVIVYNLHQRVRYYYADNLLGFRCIAKYSFLESGLLSSSLFFFIVRSFSPYFFFFIFSHI